MSVNWELKTRAFLYWPPWAALSPNHPDSCELLQFLNSLLGSAGDGALLEKAHEFAFGLDVPGFIRKRQDLWPRERSSLSIIHPLSGKPSTLPLPDIAAAKKQVQKDVQKLMSSDPRQGFLALWRLLPVCLSLNNPIWEILPADPCVPDHSIWEHAATASAFAATYNFESQAFEPALLIFTLASAQDFLAAARRTQDLWMGSFLFSWLMWQAMKPIAEEIGPDAIIYPSLHGQPLVDRWLHFEMGLQDQSIAKNATDLERLKIANFPNLFTAIVPAAEAAELGNKAAWAVQQAAQSLCESVKKYVEDAINQASELANEVGMSFQDDQTRQAFLNSVKKLDWNALWHRQKEGMLERHIFWVALPWQASRDGPPLTAWRSLFRTLVGTHPNLEKLYEAILNTNPQEENNLGLVYPLVSELAGRLLTARKNLRHFSQRAEPGHKCTQCGIREALHPGDLPADRDPYPELRAFWEFLSRIGEKGEKNKLAGRIRRGDRLCAVCLTKRLAWEAFFLEKEAKEGGFGDVKGALEGELPAHLLFPSTATLATATFKERLLQALEPHVPNEARTELWKSLSEYVRVAKEALGYQFFPAPPIPRLERMAKRVSSQSQLSNLQDQQILNDFLRLDGDWLYPESFEPTRFEQGFSLKLTVERKQKLREAREALERLLSVTDRLGIPRPQRYYALLEMDGDHIGEWLTGQRGPKLGEILHPGVAQALCSQDLPLGETRPLGAAHHRALTAALKTFALEVVRPVVEGKYTGKLIYAGGDDVLAFLPLDHLLGAMHDLYCLFTCCSSTSFEFEEGRIEFAPLPVLNRDGQERWLLLPGPKMTISAGVVIAHESHPFRDAVEEARVALQRAKTEFGRDAWTIHVLKRSGEPLLCGGKWHYGEWFVLPALQQVVEFFIQGLSPRFLYEMRRLAPGVAALEPQALSAVLQRLLRRREGLTEAQHEKFLKLRIESWPKHLASAGVEGQAWHTVATWLQLAHFLARGARG